MVTRMSDTRKMSQKQADQLLEEIANLEVELTLKLAICKREINRYKGLATAHKDNLGSIIADRAAKLNAYVLAHPDEFEKPRSRVTPFGKYGMRDVSNLEIKNEKELLQYLVDNEMFEFIKTEQSVMKIPLREAVKNGLSIPGVEIDSGTSSFYSVDSSLIDQAKKQGSKK